RHLRSHARPRMASLILRDELTDLFNRRYILERIDEEVSRSGRHGRKFCLVYFDLDDFKLVNDRFGHHAGDEFLKQAARMLEKNVRREDVMARLGGDEFLALLPDTTPSEAANLVLRMHTRFSSEEFYCAETEPLKNQTFSAGIASFPDDGDTVEKLQAAADANMYQNKQSRAD
ncbi:MAG: GGDEF domain-containing protein, partial [Planctomycetota bacterium]|nr:GGDEF domain-containing protein [Planctomycetota bacterium]